MADNLEGVNFLGKRGVNAADPRNDKDVVNLRTLRNSIANFSSNTGQTANFIFLSSLGNGLTINNGLTGNTYGIRTITGGTNTFINVLSDSTLLVDSLNYYTTGATLSGNIAFFDRNDTLSAYTLDLSTVISPEKYWTSGSTGNYSIKAYNNTAINATGNYAVAMGYDSIASGDYSTAMGLSSIATGSSSHAEGISSRAFGSYSHAEGGGSTALGSSSHAEGSSTTAYGIASHAEGTNTLATGDAAHAEGLNTIASYFSAHAEGIDTTAAGYASHSQGQSTSANGSTSFAGGYGSSANGNSSFVYGYNNAVNGLRSVVLGGINMTGSSDDTVYVPYLNIQSANTASSSDYFLARSSTGEIKLSTLNSLSAGTLSLSAITSGVLGDTIRHNGTGWTANNFLYNNGTSIGINNTSPSATLQIKGTNANSSSHSFKINDSNNNNIFSVRNDGLLSLKDGGTILFGTGSTPFITNSINSSGIQFLTSGPTQYRFGWNAGELWMTGNLNTGAGGSIILENTTVGALGKNNILFTDNLSLYTNYAWSVGPYSSEGLSNFGFRILNLKTGTTIPFYISNDVNSYVGINNISPVAQLDIVGKTRTTNLQMTSGATAGYVLTAVNSSGDAYWAPSSGGGSTTYISNGLNTYTGGTATNPTVNISGGTFANINASGNSVFNTLSAVTLSATTLFSGSTELGSLFATPAQLTRIQNGLNTYTGGTATNPTVNISGGTFANINASGNSVFNTLSAVTISGSTIYSGGTDLSTLFITNLTGVVETTGNVASFSSAGIAQIRAIATLRI